MMTMTATRPTAPGLPGVHHALVVGLGASGLAATRLLVGQGVTVTAVDEAADHAGADEARAVGATVVLGRPAVELLDGTIDLVVPSPGVPERAPVLQQAAAAGTTVWSEPELGLRVFPHDLLAITGTNGKTSTTELVAAMLAAGDRPVVACGNIGRPLSDAAGQTPPDTVLVAELSSFQLRFAETLRAMVGVVLNVADDHLDWHGDAGAYGRAKARIWVGQTTEDWAVANTDDPTSLALRDRYASGRHAAFSGTRPVALGVGRRGDDLVLWGPDGAVTELLAVDDLTSRASHHVANVAAAATLAALAGVEPGRIIEVARSYHAGAHRFETVAFVDGVHYVNDSKATNVHAAAAALGAADDIVWIAGGLAKGVDLAPLGEHLGNVRSAMLIGTAADELAGICARAGVPSEHAGSIEDAVRRAQRLARPDGTVLLAPACASFVQFRDYADRGARFSAAVRSLAATTDEGDAGPAAGGQGGSTDGT